MERRVLIVESQNDFALSMASVLRTAGFQTATAENAADALRELELRRPDLVVPGPSCPISRASCCAGRSEGRFGQGLPGAPPLPTSGRRASPARQRPRAADGYLTIPSRWVSWRR
jgi:hypothetical protein